MKKILLIAAAAAVLSAPALADTQAQDYARERALRQHANPLTLRNFAPRHAAPFTLRSAPRALTAPRGQHNFRSYPERSYPERLIEHGGGHN